MWVSVGNQAYSFLMCVLGGMIIAFIYDAFRIKRKTIKSSNIIIYFEDFIYWIIVALVLFGAVYISNEGEIRGYLIIGAILGIIIYAFLLSRIVMTVFLFIIGLVYKFVVVVFGILLIPLKIIYRILRIPAGFICYTALRGGKKVKRIGKVRLDKLKGWKRVIKIIRKKI